MKRRKGKLSKKIHKEKVLLGQIIDYEIKTNFLRNGFSNKILDEAEKISQKSLEKHKDLTYVPFITIDGENSKDFDDAVWAEVTEKYTKIMVAIADVSFYVESGSFVDKEAKKRGNSFYFPNKVIPMLPEKLSNDVCSLVPNKKRACIVVEIKFSNRSKKKSLKFTRALIKSHARLTYNEVDDIFFKKTNKKFLPLIENLFRVYEELNKNSQERGKINFEFYEFEIDYKSNNTFDLKKKLNLHSYKIIEEIMVLTNTCIAETLIKKKIKTIFRNHSEPKKEKIKEIGKVFLDIGHEEISQLLSKLNFCKIVNLLKKKKKVHLNEFLIRTQSKAIYDYENKGHFGLGLSNYLHFTSPIRRYSDLVVHRDLAHLLFKQEKINYSTTLPSLLTDQEKKSDEIERTILERACSIYIYEKKKSFFLGIVDGIEEFGIFIKCLELPFSVLVRNKFDNYRKIEPTENLKIGQKVSFRIKRNNLSNGKILGDNIKVIKNEV